MPVTDAIDALFAAWSTKDPQQFAAVFAEDAEFTDVVGNHVTGRQGIADLHVFPFGSLFRDATLTRTDIRVRELTPEWVTVDAPWSMTGHTNPLGEVQPDWAGAMHVVLAASGDGWVPTVVHNVLTRKGGAHVAL